MVAKLADHLAYPIKKFIQRNHPLLFKETAMPLIRFSFCYFKGGTYIMGARYV